MDREEFKDSILKAISYAGHYFKRKLRFPKNDWIHVCEDEQWGNVHYVIVYTTDCGNVERIQRFGNNDNTGSTNTSRWKYSFADEKADEIDQSYDFEKDNGEIYAVVFVAFSEEEANTLACSVKTRILEDNFVRPVDRNASIRAFLQGNSDENAQAHAFPPHGGSAHTHAFPLHGRSGNARRRPSSAVDALFA